MSIRRRHEVLVYTTCLKRSVRSEDGENKESDASQLRKRDHVPDKGNKVKGGSRGQGKYYTIQKKKKRKKKAERDI